MADANHSDATLTLHYHGFIVRSDPTSKFLVEEPGRADIHAVRGGRAVAIEVKDGKRSGDNAGFDMSEWRENQREWAELYCEAPPFSTPYWLWIRIGAHPPHYDPAKYNPKITWLIPRNEFLKAESKLKGIQNVLPYKARPGLRKEIQENKLDAINLFSGWELTWMKKGSVIKPQWYGDSAGEEFSKGMWVIPETHPFYEMFIGTSPIVYKHRRMTHGRRLQEQYSEAAS